MLRRAVMNCGRRRSPSARRQTGARWHNRHVPRHHASSTQLRMRSCHRRRSSCSKPTRCHRRESPPNVRIIDVRHVRELRARVQRSNPAEAVERPKSVETHYAEPPAVSTPPREEAVTRPNRQPAKAAPSAPTKTKPEAPTTSESKERHIRWRPEWTIETWAPHRSRPPRPRTAVPHPATVVIWSPSPRLISNPSPTVVRLIHPAAIAIGSPAIRLIRHPDLSVVWRVFPGSVGVQVFRPDVILIGVMPRGRLVNHVVAFAVPAIPIVRIGSGADLVLRIGAGTAHRRHVTLLDVGNTLRRRDLRLSFAHDDDAVPVGPHFDAEHAIHVRRVNCNVRGIDLRLSFTLAEHGIISQALPDLNLDVFLRKVSNVRLRIRSQAENVGVIELNLGPPARSGGNLIAVHHRLIQHSRRPGTGIATLRGHFAMSHADASNALIGLCRTLTRGSTGLSFVARLWRWTRLRLPRLLRWTRPRRWSGLRRWRGLTLPHFHRSAGLLRGARTWLSSLCMRGNRKSTCQYQSADCRTRYESVFHNPLPETTAYAIKIESRTTDAL